MATDTRDVVFQADVFQQVKQLSREFKLLVFQEAVPALQDCHANAWWIQLGWGDAGVSLIGRRPAINSGVISGGGWAVERWRER
mmetsp:Transcript_63089/g.149502  ORF Transcript_63089/g.149502 Transcript_63089/m.149502 type:complete len:84 (+) Transcript_63089:282-533(+)